MESKKYLLEKRKVYESNIKDLLEIPSEDNERMISLYFEALTDLNDDIEFLENMISHPHFTIEEIDRVNRLGPHIYRECLEQAQNHTQQLRDELNNLINQRAQGANNQGANNQGANNQGAQGANNQGGVQGLAGMIQQLGNYFNQIDNLPVGVNNENNNNDGVQNMDIEDDENSLNSEDEERIDELIDEMPEPLQSLYRYMQEQGMPMVLGPNRDSVRIHGGGGMLPNGVDFQIVGAGVHPVGGANGVAGAGGAGAVGAGAAGEVPLGAFQFNLGGGGNPFIQMIQGLMNMDMNGLEGLEDFLNQRVSTPVKPEILENHLPVQKFQTILQQIEQGNTELDVCDDNSCLVCSLPFEETSEVRVMPSCKLVLHKECADKWFTEHATCIKCRRNINDLFSE